MNSDNIAKAVVTIPKNKLSQLEAATFEGNIHVIDDEKDIETAVNQLRQSDIIGFDTETRPSFKKGFLHIVSLVQLSTRTDCYLFRINRTGLSKAIIDLLEDKSKLKIGLSIHDDFHSLRKISPFHPEGFIDLQQYVKNFRIGDNSLSRIYGILFNKRISKGQRLTNWEQETLSPSQQHYAALDAQACIKIYEYLDSGQFDPLTSPYITFPSEEPQQ